MRRAFTEKLTELADQNSRVMFLTGDLGFQILDGFAERFGPRYVNVGVAEAQLVCCAAGLALEGWRPVIYSIGSFMTGRPFEQIRVSVSYPGLPVVIVGAGGGYTYSDSGITHHAPNDIALMSGLPGMTVAIPGDPTELAHLLPQLMELPGPSYFRIGRFGEPNYSGIYPILLGQARLLRQGERVAVVSTGDIASVVLEANDALNADGIYPIVYQMHTVKPLDTGALDSLSDKVQAIVVVEEHMPVGGLFAAISAWRATRPSGPKLVRLGAPDDLVLGNPTREELRRRINCDAHSIFQTCRSLWEDSVALQTRS